MATSQNGYSANDRSVIASYTVPGTTLRIALRKGDVSVVLLEYLRRYHLEVESLYHVPQDLWGYAERTIRGDATALSNHSSGTAVDARAVKNALGATRTFTATQEGALDHLLAWFEGVLRHGKNYVSRKDPMHAEINRGPAEVARIANKIRALQAPEEDELNPDQDRLLRVIYDQVTGNNFQGWPTWEGGTGEALSLVDFARRENVETQSLHKKLDALSARLDDVEAAPPATDITAAQVVDEVIRRLKESS